MQNFLFVTQNTLNRKVSGFLAWLVLAAGLAVLAGCGSGQAIPSVPPPAEVTPPAAGTPTPGPDVASIQLLAGGTQIPSSGANTLDLTAIVLSATKQTLSGKTVTFSTGDDSTAFVNNISALSSNGAGGVSDANGLVTAKLNLGSNKLNRTIVVTAVSGTVTATNSLDVTGTTISASGNNSIAFGAATTLTFAVKDSAGNPLPNATIGVASATGNDITLTPVTGLTNSAGQITAAVKATKVGNDTVTATVTAIKADNVTLSAPMPLASVAQPLIISSASFAFSAPAGGTEIPLVPATNSTPTVTVNWADAAASPVGKTVTYSTTRGTIAGGTITSNSSTLLPTGDASVTISSATAGPAIITASGPGGTPSATLDVTFVATSADNVTVQAVPGTIQVTTGVASQTSNSSTISVLVRDKVNNLVKNAGVNFTVTVDPSGGSLKSARGVTDVNGAASVTYVAGNTSSAANGVTIQAAVTDINGVPIAPVVTNTTTLTVAGQSLLVRVGTDNLVLKTPPVYVKTYAAVVTDSAGNAVVGNSVRFALRPGRYFKGYYQYDAGVKQWVQVITTPAGCPNEDLNFNGILDVPPVVAVNEDDPTSNGNGNGRLDPGNVATVTGIGVTNASGIATASVTYPEDHSNWVEETIEARTGVVGNDPPAVSTFVLQGLATDYLDPNTQPPGYISPYGIGGSCHDSL